MLREKTRQRLPGSRKQPKLRMRLCSAKNDGMRCRTSGQPDRIPIGFTGPIRGVPANDRSPLDFMGLTIPVIQGDRLTTSVTVDPALVAPDWLLWGRVIEADETNNTDSRQCDAVP